MVNDCLNTTVVEQLVQTGTDQKAPERFLQEYKTDGMSHVSEYVNISFTQLGDLIHNIYSY